jgi:hypothetical protein
MYNYLTQINSVSNYIFTILTNLNKQENTIPLSPSSNNLDRNVKYNVHITHPFPRYAVGTTGKMG